MNENTGADGIWACHVVDEDRVWLWSGIDVDDGFATLSMDTYGACGEDCSIEGVVAKLVRVEA